MKVIDLFAGMGGFTEGAEQAGCEVVWAGNHWPSAVACHAENHPSVIHACQDLHQANWAEVPAHDVLLASPACQGHTPARGKDRPHHDATRSTAWAVISALEFHRPKAALVENVVDFQKWLLYPAWVAAAHALGYAVSPHIVDAADHGIPQHRVRLILVLTRSVQPLCLQPHTTEHQPISSALDFNAGTWSQINRKGRAPATLARIDQGRSLYGDRFLIPYYGSGSGKTGRSIDRPVGTITTRDRWALIDGDRMRMMSKHEARRAMGFREDYRLPTAHKDAIFMLGNAVCPPKARDYLLALKAAA